MHSCTALTEVEQSIEYMIKHNTTQHNPDQPSEQYHSLCWTWFGVKNAGNTQRGRRCCLSEQALPRSASLAWASFEMPWSWKNTRTSTPPNSTLKNVGSTGVMAPKPKERSLQPSTLPFEMPLPCSRRIQRNSSLSCIPLSCWIGPKRSRSMFWFTELEQQQDSNREVLVRRERWHWWCRNISRYRPWRQS